MFIDQKQGAIDIAQKMNLNNLVSVLRADGKLQPAQVQGFASKQDQTRSFSVQQTRNAASVGDLSHSKGAIKNAQLNSGTVGDRQDPFKNLKQVMDQVDPYSNLNHQNSLVKQFIQETENQGNQSLPALKPTQLRDAIVDIDSVGALSLNKTPGNVDYEDSHSEEKVKSPGKAEDTKSAVNEEDFISERKSVHTKSRISTRTRQGSELQDTKTLAMLRTRSNHSPSASPSKRAPMTYRLPVRDFNKSRYNSQLGININLPPIARDTKIIQQLPHWDTQQASKRYVLEKSKQILIKKQRKQMEYSGKESGTHSERTRLKGKKSQGAFESSQQEELAGFFFENKADPGRLEQTIEKYDMKQVDGFTVKSDVARVNIAKNKRIQQNMGVYNFEQYQTHQKNQSKSVSQMTKNQKKTFQEKTGVFITKTSSDRNNLSRFEANSSKTARELALKRGLINKNHSFTPKKYTAKTAKTIDIDVKPPIKDYSSVIETALQKLSLKNYENWSMLVKLCFDGAANSGKTKAEVNPVELMRFHPFFNKLTYQTVKYLLAETKLCKLNTNQLLYSKDSRNTGIYIVLFGTLVLHHETLGALGVLTMENTIGEESQIKGLDTKLDSAYSQTEAYLLEYDAKKWAGMRLTLMQIGRKADLMRLERFIQHNFNQKSHWRSRQASRLVDTGKQDM